MIFLPLYLSLIAPTILQLLTLKEVKAMRLEHTWAVDFALPKGLIWLILRVNLYGELTALDALCGIVNLILIIVGVRVRWSLIL